MNYYKLPIYNALRIFYKGIKIHTNKTSKDEREAFVIPVMQKIDEMMTNIAYLNESNEKITYIDENIDIIRKIQIKIRNWFEMGVITKKGFGSLCDDSAKVVRQFNGWKKSIIKDDIKT